MTFAFLIALIITSNCMSADSKSEQIPLFEETELFVGGQDDINTYRIPSLVCTKKGTVLGFCEGRRDKSQDGSPTHLVLKRSLMNTGPMVPPEHDIYEYRSRQRNMTWQPMQILLQSKNGEAYMNPVPVIDSGDGTIFLLVNRYPTYGDVENEGKGVTEVWLMKSIDDGATWTDPIDITPDVGNIALGPGIGIQMNNGRLVAPVYDGVVFSDDHGKTWKAGNKTTGPVSECQVVELADGSLMLNTRGYPQRTVAISNDNGDTWGEPYKDIIEYYAKLSFARFNLEWLTDGNDHLSPDVPRINFVVMSEIQPHQNDSGVIWYDNFVVSTKPIGPVVCPSNPVLVKTPYHGPGDLAALEAELSTDDSRHFSNVFWRD